MNNTRNSGPSHSLQAVIPRESLPREATSSGLNSHRLARIVRRELDQATRDASEVVARASAHAEKVRQEAEDFAERSRVKLLQDARETARAELAAEWLAVSKAAAAVEANLQEDMFRGAALIAERVIRAELHADATRLRGMALEAVREVRGARSMVLRVNPVDAPELERTLQEALRGGAASIRVETDEMLSRGDILVQADVGNVDARLTVQIARLVQVIRRAAASQERG
jgi:flagellar biosynthesis/type III secretory pathway protein FliH